MVKIETETIKRYLQKYSDTPTLTLAKLIFSRNLSLFQSVEQIRSRIRHLRGQHGVRNRKGLTDTSFITEVGSRSPYPNLPEGIKHFADWTPVKISADRLLVIADLHVPYHDHAALAITLDYAREKEVTGILINGDGCDFYQASDWQKDPRRRSLSEELKTLRTILSIIREMFPDAEMVYKMGNHEERWERYLKIKAPAFTDLFDDDDIPLLSYETIFDTKKYDIKVVANKRLVKFGHLNIVHGHEFWRGMINPVNPARGLFLKGKENALGAHLHQTSHHTEPTLSGDILSCWTTGCLCDLHPEYSPFNKWNHGFAIINRDGDNFEVLNKTIIEGKIY